MSKEPLTSNLLFLDTLYNADILLNNGQVNSQRIQHLSKKAILEICEQLHDYTSSFNLQPDPKIFSHSASLPLSGGRFPCSANQCRHERLSSLAQFAAFYSDRVFAYNFAVDCLRIERHSASSSFADKLVSVNLRFLNDMQLISTILPLIQQDIIVPISPPELCSDCFAKVVLHHPDLTVYTHLLNYTADCFLQETEFSIRKTGDERYEIRNVGPEALIEHGTIIMTTNKSPLDLSKHDFVRHELASGALLKLPKELVLEAGLHLKRARSVFQSAAFEISLSSTISSHYLTDREFDVNLIRALSVNRGVTVDRDRLIQKHLSCLVPVINDLSTEDILEIRQQNLDSFVLFRAALNRAIDEYQSLTAFENEKSLNDIYQDILRPKLAELSMKLENARKSSLQSKIRNGIVLAGSIVVGLKAPLLSESYRAIVQAFGAASAAVAIDKIMANHNTPETLRSDEFYFLWLAHKKATV